MTLRCIECPEYDLPWATQIEDREMRLPHRKVFLAGGITGCPDWQAERETIKSIVSGWTWANKVGDKA